MISDKHPSWVRFIVTRGRSFGKKFIVREALHLLMEPMAILDDSLTPIDHGCGMLVVFEK